MNPGTIFFKTDKGKGEVTERAAGLSAVQRRLLIVIDGKKTHQELSNYARGGELDASLAHLQALGLIDASGLVLDLPAPSAPGFAAAPLAEPPRPATNAREFEHVRAEVSQFVHDKLGDAGEPIRHAIDRCANPIELRAELRAVEIFVGQQLGHDAAHTFVQHFGALLL